MPQLDDSVRSIAERSSREEAGRIGVEGIPTFVTGRFGLSGCQPYAVLVDFVTHAGVKRR